MLTKDTIFVTRPSVYAQCLESLVAASDFQAIDLGVILEPCNDFTLKTHEKQGLLLEFSRFFDMIISTAIADWIKARTPS